MLTAEIPNDVWKSAIIIEDKEKKIYRMDVIWAYLSITKNPDGTMRFPKLSKVARLVLTLPHSNVEEERVFSMVTENKTSFRPNLGMAGTLQSILTIKLGNSEPCTNMSHPRKYWPQLRKLRWNTTEHIAVPLLVPVLLLALLQVLLLVLLLLLLLLPAVVVSSVE